MPHVLIYALVLMSFWFNTAHSQDLRTIEVRRLSRPPLLEEFRSMAPPPELQSELQAVDGFVQRQPSDGTPVSQRTVVYLGYDADQLYAVFVCFDTDPGRIRARMYPRDSSPGDDWVHVALDTFNDRRRAYIFGSYPFGIQWDGLWTEGGEGPDASFDTLYHSRGMTTDQGFVVWIAIPFKSLRFPPQREQQWSVMLARGIPRSNEEAYWPGYSSRIEGRMNQAATLTGIRDISPGRNLQLLPFGTFRSAGYIDTTPEGGPLRVRDRSDGDAGLDAKIVFRDSLVTDVAINPDFSQVESDEPQITANQRFEVFFPEKRPFFLENSNYFATPVNLLFTRRIEDPQFGVRLTGKVSRYAVGALLIDDQARGRRTPGSDSRAALAALRIDRDFGRRSGAGLIYVERQFRNERNRAAGIDGRVTLGSNWSSRFQAVATTSRGGDGQLSAGQAYQTELKRQGRSLNLETKFTDRSPGFAAAAGFEPRANFRSVSQTVNYEWRPEGRVLISWGPDITAVQLWNRAGTPLETTVDPKLRFEFGGQTFAFLTLGGGSTRLSPEDYSLDSPRTFRTSTRGLYFTSERFKHVAFSSDLFSGTAINFEPEEGSPPHTARSLSGSAAVTLRPHSRLSIDNRYIFTRLRGVFANHIGRVRAAWQFNRELSVRAIVQYDDVRTETGRSSIDPYRRVNTDILWTYQVNAWTALFVGVNTNARDTQLVTTGADRRLVRTPGQLHRDSHLFFVKFSYLLRL